jgi:hypothetical protein
MCDFKCEIHIPETDGVVSSESVYSVGARDVERASIGAGAREAG